MALKDRLQVRMPLSDFHSAELINVCIRRGEVSVQLTSKTNVADKLMGSQKTGTTAMARYTQFYMGIGSKGSVDTFIAEDL